MAILSERDIISDFSGRPVCMENLNRCAHKNRTIEKCVEYIVYSCGFLYDPFLLEQFGITSKLKETWERRGIDFNLYINISDGMIMSCRIGKYRESEGARASCNDLKCTQQELRVAKRIFEFLTFDEGK